MAWPWTFLRARALKLEGCFLEHKCPSCLAIGVWKCIGTFSASVCLARYFGFNYLKDRDFRESHVFGE